MSFSLFPLLWLIFFLALMAGRAIFMRLALGVSVFTLARGKRGLHWWLEMAFLPLLCAWMIELTFYAFALPMRLFPYPLSNRIVDGALAQYLGAAMLMVSMMVFAWALISFGRSWRVGIDQREPGTLVRGGVFAYSRNPICVCLNLGFVGVFLIYGSVIFLLFAVLMIAGVHLQIREEESFLRRHYGMAYDDYCRLTNRYVGRRN